MLDGPHSHHTNDSRQSSKPIRDFTDLRPPIILFARLGANDRLAVFQSDATASMVASFTNSRPTVGGIVDAMKNIAPGSALLDTVDQAIRAVSTQSGRRQVVVVFGAGETSSGVIRDAAVVRQTARSFGIPVFVLANNAMPPVPLATERIAVQLSVQHVVTWTSSPGAAPKLFGLTFTGSQGTAVFNTFFRGCR